MPCCAPGILAGSFADVPINGALANKTSFGSLFATCGSCFSCCLYPEAGAAFLRAAEKRQTNCENALYAIICGTNKL